MLELLQLALLCATFVGDSEQEDGQNQRQSNHIEVSRSRRTKSAPAP
jgi:hypothetical protein